MELMCRDSFYNCQRQLPKFKAGKESTKILVLVRVAYTDNCVIKRVHSSGSDDMYTVHLKIN
jgi:hypothetical protein